MFQKILFSPEEIGNSKRVGEATRQESMKLDWNFQRGGVGGLRKHPLSVRGRGVVWIFSGTIHQQIIRSKCS